MKSSIDKRGEGVSAAIRYATALGLALLAASCCLQLQLGVEAHVALTYPPARALDLDFLDNSRTKAPCGMPKGKCNGKVYCRYFFWGAKGKSRSGKMLLEQLQQQPLTCILWPTAFG